MSFREKIQKSPLFGVSLAVALIVLAGVLVLTVGKRTRVIRHDEFFYVNLDTLDLFHAPQATAPVDVPGGAAGKGARAYVFGCGSCAEDQQHIVYLETLTDRGIQASRQKPANAEQAAEIQHVVMRESRVAPMPEKGQPPQWVPAYSEAADRIRNQPRTLCPSAAPVECFP